MPKKTTPSKKRQRKSEEFKTPSKVIKSSAVQSFLNLCTEEGKLYVDAFKGNVKSNLQYELKDMTFDDKVILAKQLRDLISDEEVREIKKLEHFEEVFTKDANEAEESYLKSLVEKTVTEAGVIVSVSTDTNDLLFEKKKLTKFIQIIDKELLSRKNAQSVVVWKMALEEIVKKDLARSNDNTSVIGSYRGSSSSSSANRSTGTLFATNNNSSLPPIQPPQTSSAAAISDAGSPLAARF